MYIISKGEQQVVDTLEGITIKKLYSFVASYQKYIFVYEGSEQKAIIDVHVK